MNIQREIDRLIAEIRETGKKIRWLRENESRLKDLPQGNFYGPYLDFDQLPHAEVIKVVRTVGGKFKKSPNSDSRRIDYVREKPDGDGTPFQIRCWSGEPPPSCRIVEVEETVPEQVIPAHVRKVRKMVCKPDLSATIAIARQPQPSANPVP